MRDHQEHDGSPHLAGGGEPAPFRRGPTARIVIEPDHASVEPAEARLLSLLRYETQHLVAGDGGTETVESHVTTFFRVGVGGRLMFMPGLVATVRRRLRSLGYEVQIDDRRRYGPRCEPDGRAIERATYRDGQLMRAAARRATGQIITRRNRDVIARMAALCRAFPHARVLVMTATKGRARRYWRELRKALREPVQLATGPWHTRHRLVVCTYCYTDPAAWDLVLLPDPRELGGQRAMAMLPALLGPSWTESVEPLAKRAYAFPRSSRDGDGLARRMTAALVGPAIYSDERLDPQVQVAWVDAPAAPAAQTNGQIDRKRRHSWRNAPRNDLIAGIARALAERDVDALRSHGLLVGVDESVIRAPVAIVVETREHGEQLLDRLPGWTLRAVRGDGVREVPPRDPRTPPARIITTLTAAHLEPVSAGTWIWAGGGDHVPDVDTWSEDDPLLIDVADNHDHRARRETERRADIYRDRGWRWDDEPGPTGSPGRPDPGNPEPPENRDGPGTPTWAGNPVPPARDTGPTRIPESPSDSPIPTTREAGAPTRTSPGERREA